MNVFLDVFRFKSAIEYFINTENECLLTNQMIKLSWLIDIFFWTDLHSIFKLSLESDHNVSQIFRLTSLKNSQEDSLHDSISQIIIKLLVSLSIQEQLNIFFDNIHKLI